MHSASIASKTAANGTGTEAAPAWRIALIVLGGLLGALFLALAIFACWFASSSGNLGDTIFAG